jgi:hypothetical protein
VIALIVAAAFEGVSLGAFLWLMNFEDTLHKLLLVHAFLVYGTLAMGLIALAEFARYGNLRVLQAIDLLVQKPQSE